MIIQIYEIQTPFEAEPMVELGVDHIGSVLLSEGEWKKPVLKDAIDLVRGTPSKSSLIPLFNNSDSVFRALDYYSPDIVHFCEALEGQGDEFIENLIQLQEGVRERFPNIKVMRSIPIAETGKAGRVSTLEFAMRFESVSDFFLTDTLILGDDVVNHNDQPVGCFVGITGKVCDWEMAAKLVDQSVIPVILAGGISPENVSEAIDRTHPAGIDSCTLTNAVDEQGEHIRFRKDLEKVRKLIEEVRASY
ncbi:MAG: hypothetical protein HN337_01260 [Deltaproteobacteria bacterium]|jgi:phosphoribosylanthranilate isomerase|nr:hypothetical protein [Deltaproteobacteria bacterium]